MAKDLLKKISEIAELEGRNTQLDLELKESKRIIGQMEQKFSASESAKSKTHNQASKVSFYSISLQKHVFLKTNF